MIFRARLRRLPSRRVQPSNPQSRKATQTDCVVYDDGIERRALVMEDGATQQLPSWTQCPIGHHVMIDPVVASDGHSYDRANLQRWLTRKQTSPLTGRPVDFFVPNHALRLAIENTYHVNRQ